jgi:hypothetical protein
MRYVRKREAAMIRWDTSVYRTFNTNVESGQENQNCDLETKSSASKEVVNCNNSEINKPTFQTRNLPSQLLIIITIWKCSNENSGFYVLLCE